MPIRLCAIGCGEHAASSHGPAQARYAREHAGLALTACCDVNSERAERHRAAFGFERAYTDVCAMLDAEQPDVAVLVVPDSVTAELACLVLGRGIPLLLEKPPGRTVDEVDGMIAAAERCGRSVPHQVAFNRRFAPLVRELKRELARLGPAIQHLHYEMTRVNRRDPDFSTTTIHGIDAVRYLAGCDYAHVRFRHQELGDLGPGVANIFMDAVMTSGATAHLAFCPTGGVVVERATVQAHDHTFFLRVPMWAAFDSPGRLQHLEKGCVVSDTSGDTVTDGPAAWELGGFYGEYVAFLGDLSRGRAPSPTLRESRQSVEVAQCIRERREEFRA